MNMKSVLEGLLFLVGDEGIDMKDICDILELDEENIKSLINNLQKDYLSSDRGIIIKKFGDNYKLTTKSENKYFYEKLSEKDCVRNLSQSALETLAIIAYNEPITRSKIDELRGINSSQMIRNLIAKDFVKEVGKSDLPGRPNLYGITNEFLDYFGLEDIKDLPKLEKVGEDSELDDSDLFLQEFESKMNLNNKEK